MHIPVVRQLEDVIRPARRRCELALRPWVERIERTLRPTLRADVKSALAPLTPFSVAGFRKVRIGAAHDGGYVMVDHFEGITAALSLGIGPDDSWDVAMANRAIPVLQFDHTIDAPPTKHPLCTFIRKKIVSAAGDRGEGTTLGAVAGGCEGDLILKIDIEDDEWNVFDGADTATLLRFRQIVCEFHYLKRLRRSQWRQAAGRVLHKLSRTHVPVHVHGVNHNRIRWIVGVPVPDVIEVTFVRRHDYQIRMSDEVFPTALDSPNNPTRGDLDLTGFLSEIRDATIERHRELTAPSARP